MTTYRSPEPDSSSGRSVSRQIEEREWVWGNNINQKSKGIVRIGFLNINGFPLQQSDQKSLQLRQYITGLEFDLMGMAEINRCWAATNQSLNDILWE